MAEKDKPHGDCECTIWLTITAVKLGNNGAVSRFQALSPLKAEPSPQKMTEIGRSRLVPRPGIADAQIRDDLPKAICKIHKIMSALMIAIRIDDGDPVMLGGPVDRHVEIRRPPLGVALIDQNQ